MEQSCSLLTSVALVVAFAFPVSIFVIYVRAHLAKRQPKVEVYRLIVCYCQILIQHTILGWNRKDHYKFDQLPGHFLRLKFLSQIIHQTQRDIEVKCTLL